MSNIDLGELPLKQQPWWPSLTPAMRSVLEGVERLANPPMQSLSPVAAREQYAKAAQALELAVPALACVQDYAIPARDRYSLPVRLYAPHIPDAQSPLPVVLYLHGGGFTIGAIETHDVLCRRMAQLSGAAVVSLAYRLAPEHRFPVAAHDAMDAFDWLAENAANWGLDGSRLAVAGDSAGGTLAAVVALHARNRGMSALKAQVLIYPGTTAHQDTASHEFFSRGPILNKPLIDWFFNQYIDTADRADWRFSPLFADDLTGLAPALLVLAECDPLIDEGLAYADALRMAGGHVDLELYKGVAHEFIKMGRVLPEALLAHQAIARALRAAFRL